MHSLGRTPASQRQYRKPACFFFELGYVSTNTAQTVQTAPPTYQTVYYQGYFAQDTWQVTNKLTATLGIRYEVPGTFISRNGWADTFNPTRNELGCARRIWCLRPGQFGAAPGSGCLRNENWNDWAPRVGVAYRLNNDTVIRAAFESKFFVPADLQFPSAPLQAGVNFLNNLMVNSTDGQQTPANTLDNPYPTGLLAHAPPGMRTFSRRYSAAMRKPFSERAKWRYVPMERVG